MRARRSTHLNVRAKRKLNAEQRAQGRRGDAILSAVHRVEELPNEEPLAVVLQTTKAEQQTARDAQWT